MHRFLKHYRPEIVLAGIVLVLTMIPVLDLYLIVGDDWQGVLPAFADESLYQARTQTLVEGYTGGNPYFLERSNDPPLVIFGGAWINAVPQQLGLSFLSATAVNFVLWSLLFAVAGYWLFRELRTPSWIAVLGTVFLYVQSYTHVWRPVNLQPVYPLFIAFYAAMIRMIRDPSRANRILLGVLTGVTFYLFAFLWQLVVITLGLLFLYALSMRDGRLAKAIGEASALGGLIGLPVPLYMLWLSQTSPYYWESMERLGLVSTHLPMAEVIYSGGWIGVVLVLVGFLYKAAPALWEDRSFSVSILFLVVSGLGLWIMQGSNLITGKLLETGEHLRLFVMPWLVFAGVTLGVYVWRLRDRVSRVVLGVTIVVLGAVTWISTDFLVEHIRPFMPGHIDMQAWETQQQYAGPLAWLDANEDRPVVVWVEPRDYLATALPIISEHFVLYAFWGVLELMPEDEVRERYLVSQYFNDLTAIDLKDPQYMELYLGRGDLAHKAKTIEREVKVCQIVFFWKKYPPCGESPTPQSLLGDAFFETLEKRFQEDIKPNIREYLKKYHVAYLIKDKVRNPTYHPTSLGASRVYEDDRYEIYKLPPL